MVKFLLDNGANPHVKPEFGSDNPIDINYDNHDIVKLLNKFGASLNENQYHYFSWNKKLSFGI